MERLDAARGGIRAEDLDGQAPAGEVERPQPARRAGSQRADDLQERRAVGAPGADDRLFLDRSRGSRHRDRILARAARRILQPLRRHLSDHLREGRGVGIADLAEGLEPGLLERAFEMAGQVGEEGELLAREEQRLVPGRPRATRGRAQVSEPRASRDEARPRDARAQPPLQLVLDPFGGAPGGRGRLRG